MCSISTWFLTLKMASPFSPGPSPSMVSGSEGTVSTCSITTTGRRRSSAIWDYWVYDKDSKKSVCQCVIKVVGTDGTEKEALCSVKKEGECICIIYVCVYVKQQ